MSKLSAGLLMYRMRGGRLEVLLVHPGGPFWAKKDLGAWSIPKGLVFPGEDPLSAARREFREETGFEAGGRFIGLGSIRQPGGKTISAWAFEGDLDAAQIESNKFSIEWPPRSGKTQQFPEVDRAEWFDIEEAAIRIVRGQAGFLDALRQKASGGGAGD
jgi:predicted NUDIX family NTP pyrophosphohydrolase